MSESFDKCPECHCDGLQVDSIRDIHAPRRQQPLRGDTQKALAQTIWVSCRLCGWSGPIVKKTSDMGPAV